MDQRSILVLHLSNTMGTLPHRLTPLPLTKDTMGRVTTVAQIRVISVDSNKVWSCSSRRTRMRGVERTSIRHQLVCRQERRQVMVSSDENNGRGEVRGKSGFIDLNRGHMASWSVECLIWYGRTWESAFTVIQGGARRCIWFPIECPRIVIQICLPFTAISVELGSNPSNDFLRACITELCSRSVLYFIHW